MSLPDGSWDSFVVIDRRSHHVALESAALTVLADNVPRAVLATSRSVYLALCQCVGVPSSITDIVHLAAVSKRTAYERLREIERVPLVERVSVTAPDGGSLPSTWALLPAGGLATVANPPLATVANQSRALALIPDQRSTGDVAVRRLSPVQNYVEGGPPTPTPSPAERVFEAWVSSRATGRPSKLTPERRRLIEKWLRQYPEDDLVAAVRGWRHSPWHRGENPSNKPYNDIELLLRDAKRIEQFAGLELDPSSRPDLRVLETQKANAFRSVADQARRFEHGAIE